MGMPLQLYWIWQGAHMNIKQNRDLFRLRITTEKSTENAWLDAFVLHQDVFEPRRMSRVVNMIPLRSSSRSFDTNKKTWCQTKIGKEYQQVWQAWSIFMEVRIRLDWWKVYIKTRQTFWLTHWTTLTLARWWRFFFFWRMSSILYLLLFTVIYSILLTFFNQPIPQVLRIQKRVKKLCSVNRYIGHTFIGWLKTFCNFIITRLIHI